MDPETANTTLAEPPSAGGDDGWNFDTGEPRYEVEDLLGRGGMGEVLSARDRRIDREVAFKRLRATEAAPNEVARFFREARIQARLDHPAIVPVHDVGVDEQGRPYFIMKRLAGTTMQQKMLDGPLVRTPLLRAFVDVCLAIDLAHSRGIVHRDLKPANIMLGDYGEVYVLDWGLARELDRARTGATTARESFPGETMDGAMLGTPGYMPPEQIRDAASVGRPADVYALGAILFEILGGEPLHPRDDALASTLDGIDGSPARRAPAAGVPPELDALCVAMLATAPAQRPPVREVADRVQAYLDGDRDHARRRILAAQELTRAQEAIDDDRHADAMRSAGRALALEPELAGAAELVGRLMIEPPRDPPPALAAEIAATEAAQLRHHARSVWFVYLTAFLFLPIMVWNGVLAWPTLIAILVMSLVLSLSLLRVGTSGARSDREITMYVIGTGMLLGLIGRVTGPLVIAPVFAVTVFTASLTYPTINRRPGISVVTVLAGWLLPVALEQLGMLGRTWAIRDGAVVAMSNMFALGGSGTTAFVFGATLSMIVVAGYQAVTISRGQLDAQRKLTTQAWQLRNLLPR